MAVICLDKYARTKFWFAVAYLGSTTLLLYCSEQQECHYGESEVINENGTAANGTAM